MSHDEAHEPHSPDVRQRQTLDEGFSAGWGFHMQPSVRYWLDCHTHMRESITPAVIQCTADWHGHMVAHRLRRHVAVDGTHANAEAFAAVAAQDDRFLWLCRLAPNQPDPDHLRRCKRLGAVGLKLHNAPLMSGDFDRRIVREPAWQAVYQLAGELGFPVLWHVTQRLSDSPYTGGGSDSYWKIGRPRGVTFHNEDILRDFLAVVAAHRNTVFIGAHQLHLGPDRLAALLAEHSNLVIDTSIGCFVAYGDRMYDADRRRWREFVVAHADRILFGTDVVINSRNVNTELLRQHFLGHLRFIKQLQLPQAELSKVAHENFERLTGLAAVQPGPWGALRP